MSGGSLDAHFSLASLYENELLACRKMFWHLMDGKQRHPRQGWRCTKSLPSFCKAKTRSSKIGKDANF